MWFENGPFGPAVRFGGREGMSRHPQFPDWPRPDYWLLNLWVFGGLGEGNFEKVSTAALKSFETFLNVPTNLLCITFC